MDVSEKIARLNQALQEPEGKYTHEQIRAKLSDLTAQYSSPASPEGEAPLPPPKPQPASLGERLESGAHRLADTVGPAVNTAARVANRAINTATFGMMDRGLDALANTTGVRIGDTPDQRDQFQREHPFLANTGEAVGYVAPVGLPARVAESAGRGVDALTNALIKRRLLTQAPGIVPTAARVAARGLAGAAKGSIAAGTTRGLEGVVAGESPAQAGKDAMDAATNPVAPIVGGVIGGAQGASAEGAAAAREASPDLAALHRHGLEPGPIPGRPVIWEGQPISSQLPGLSEPPLGVSTVTPETRGAAARSVGDRLESDLDATERANNKRYGELKDAALAKEGQNPAELLPALRLIDQHLADIGVPRDVKANLTEIRDVIMGNQNSHGIGITTKAGVYGRANDVDGLRRLVDSKINWSRSAGMSDVPFMQLRDELQKSLDRAAPQTRALEAAHAKYMTGLDERRALLGDPERQGSARNPYAREREGSARAARIRQAGEHTATAGGQETYVGTRMDRLADMGPAPAHPGAAVPIHPNYRATLDVPRLQLAQENLQVTPSKVFSGAGSTVAHNALKYLPLRVAYPLARRLGDSDLASAPLAADPLIRALRGRKRNDQEEQDNAN